MWIDGPVERTVPAHPFEEFFAGIAHHGFGGPMDHDDASAILHQSIEFVELGIEEVALVTSAKDDDGRCVFEYGGVFRVADIGEDLGVDAKFGLVDRLC